MLFDIYAPARILFGPGSTYRLGEEVAALGKRILLVTGRQSLKQSGNIERITQPLAVAGIETVAFDEVSPEPVTTTVDAGRRRAREESCAVVVGVGGGSVLDVAKAIAGLGHAEGETREYLHGREITTPGLPFVAVPTTAGSGSEVTQSVVLVDPETGKKSSLRNDRWLPRVAVVDPILTMSMPRELTAQTGMDALTHAVEAYTSRWANAYTRSLSREAVRLIVQNFYTAHKLPGRRDARESMLLGSMLAGMALNVARAGAVHALAHPIGTRYGLGHGLVCGILLPYVAEFNLAVVEGEYAELARHAGLVSAGVPEHEAAGRFVHYLRRLTNRLKLPEKLGPLGLIAEDIPNLVEAAMDSSSLAANSRKATRQDLAAILKRSL